MEVSPEHINSFLSKCKSSNWAGVFFSPPFQSTFQFWLQDLNQPKNLSSEKFIFSPFDSVLSPVLILHPNKKNSEAVQYLGDLPTKTDCWPNDQLSNVSSTTAEQYHQQFDQYISAIQSGKCQKAILSTIITGTISEQLNIGEYIFKLRKEYPQAFIYILSSPFAGTWLGATPETLLNWQNNTVTTMSLAGTKRSGSNEFDFGSKEKTEQEIVTNYITDIFRKRFSNVELMEREELHYGEMTHLLSRMKATSDKFFTADQFLEFANEIHPTPAVGGFPVKQALELIVSTEEHSRLYYSGFMGVVGKDFGELVVNLRCMSLAHGKYYAFAGGGITVDSDPEAEWTETRLKANALLKFL